MQHPLSSFELLLNLRLLNPSLYLKTNWEHIWEERSFVLCAVEYCRAGVINYICRRTRVTGTDTLGVKLSKKNTFL